MNKRDDWMIRSTTDYNIFEVNEINRMLHRNVRPNVYARLRESMASRGFLRSKHITCSHIVGSNKLKIVEGHNRFDVARELKLPILYVIDDNIGDIHAIEAAGATSWSMGDWVHGYANKGNQNYTAIIEFRDRYNLTLSATIGLLSGMSAGSGTGNVAARVKSGQFVLGDLTHANDVVSVTEAAREVGITFATRQSFVSAVSACLRVDQFDRVRMIDQIRKYAGKLMSRVTVDENLSELESVYNYGAKDMNKRLPLRHLAMEIMRSRQETFAGKRGSPARRS